MSFWVYRDHLEVILASWSTLKHQGSPHGSQDASWERLGCFLAPSPRESLTPWGHLFDSSICFLCVFVWAAFWTTFLIDSQIDDFGGGRHARNVAHSVRVLVLRVFIQDGLRDLSGDPLGPHFGIILASQSLHYTTLGVIFRGSIFEVIFGEGSRGPWPASGGAFRVAGEGV